MVCSNHVNFFIANRILESSDGRNVLSEQSLDEQEKSSEKVEDGAEEAVVDDKHTTTIDSYAQYLFTMNEVSYIANQHSQYTSKKSAVQQVQYLKGGLEKLKLN